MLYGFVTFDYYYVGALHTNEEKVMMILYLFRLNIWFDIEEVYVFVEKTWNGWRRKLRARLELVVLKIKDFMHEIARG